MHFCLSIYHSRILKLFLKERVVSTSKHRYMLFDQCGFRLIRSKSFIPFLYMCPLKFRIVRPIMKQKVLTTQKKVARKLSPANSVARLCFRRPLMLPQAQFRLGHHPRQTCQNGVFPLLYFTLSNN
jgi:hypothetical protein